VFVCCRPCSNGGSDGGGDELLFGTCIYSRRMNGKVQEQTTRTHTVVAWKNVCVRDVG